MDTLGNRTKLMREAKGLSLSGLAEASGLTKAYLVRIEHDRCNLTLRSVGRLAEALGVGPEWLAYAARPALHPTHPEEEK